jgi:hypothetical protein
METHHHYYNSYNDSKLDLIISKLDLIMTKQEKLDAALDRLNTTTNDIAADLVLLKQQIAAGTVTDESLARLDANVATLEALGASTENPVPEPVPPIEPPAEPEA